MAAATTGQPKCSGCGSLLPWEDVDRVAGRCRTCDTAFDFAIPPGTHLELLPLRQPTEPRRAPENLSSELEVPAHTPKPRGLSVVQSEGTAGDYRIAPKRGTLALRWKRSQAGPIFFMSVGAASTLATYLVLRLRSNAGSLRELVGAFGFLCAFVAVYLALRGDVTEISATGTTLDVVRMRRPVARLPLDDLIGFACFERAIPSGTNDESERTYRLVYEIVAVRRAGVNVRLAQSDDAEIAFHVVSLLRQHLVQARNVA